MNFGRFKLARHSYLLAPCKGRAKPRPKPEVKKLPTTAEIRAANPGKVGGGNAGASTDSGGTSQSTFKSVEQKPEVKTPVKKMHPIEKRNREIHGDKRVDFLKQKQSDFKNMQSKGMSKADFAKKYPNSNVAKDLRKSKRVTSVMDMESYETEDHEQSF